MLNASEINVVTVLALFQEDHAVNMDVNLMRAAHFQRGAGAAERPAFRSQRESMDRLKWTRTGFLAMEVPAVQSLYEKICDAVISTSRYKKRRKRNMLLKWQINADSCDTVAARDSYQANSSNVRDVKGCV